MTIIEYGEAKTFGDTLIGWGKHNDRTIILVGNTEIPITFEYEDNPNDGYGVGCAREMYELEAMDEYAVYIGDQKFSGIHKTSLEAIGVDDYQETDGAISFELSFIESNVIRPGNWCYAIGTVKIEDGKITVVK